MLIGKRGRRGYCELMFGAWVELHAYNNQFGAHMAYIMRRLRRLCVAVGNEDIRFISCSATVANPEEVFPFPALSSPSPHF